MPKWPKILIFTSELVIVLGSFFLIYFILGEAKGLYRLDPGPQEVLLRGPWTLGLYEKVLGLAVVLWAGLLWRRGGHQNFHIQSYRGAASCMAVNGFFFLLLFASFSFLFKFDFLSRAFIFLYTVSTTAWLILNRCAMLKGFKELRRKGGDARHILLVGTGRRAQAFISDIAKHTEWGYKLLGLIDRDPGMKGEIVAGYKVLGILEDLPALLGSEVVDEVVFITPRTWLEEIRKCILYCEAVGVPATLSTDFFDLEIALGVPKKMEGKTYLTVETRTPKGGELILKRAFDILVSASVLIFMSPVLLMVAWAVKATSPGPVFFRQIRCGRNGRRFVLYKFRSMVIDAEARLEALQTKNEMSGPVFKITDDPRITSVGKFLRKTSLDEFSQFWNVLKGDMSLVGPRPPLPSEVIQYEPWQRRRLSMQPGITCIWQVTQRHGVDFEKWMEMDLNYIDNWALLLDLKILVLTGRAVFTGSGK